MVFQRKNLSKKNYKGLVITTFLRACSLLFTMAFCQLVSAKMFTYKLQHKTAQEIIPKIARHLPEDAQLDGSGDQLIVKGGDGVDKIVTEMLNILDIREREYFINIRVSNYKLHLDELNKNNKLSEIKQNTLVNGELSNQSSKQNSNPQQQNRRQIKSYKVQSTAKNHGSLSIRTLENSPAFIQTGESVERVRIDSQYGHLIPKSTKKNKSLDGFYVSAQENSGVEGTVKVKFWTQNQFALNHGQSINSLKSGTQTILTKNIWQLIASNKTNTENKTNLKNTSKTYRVNSKQSRSQWIYLRVNEILN